MEILAVNCGSKSLKFSFYKNKTELLSGSFKLFDNFEKFYLRKKESIIEQESEITSYKEKVQKIISYINSKDLKIIHRIVHGGEKYLSTVKLNPKIINDLEKNYSRLAPIHNIPAIKIIKYFMNLTSEFNQYATFDTSFFANIPQENYLYALPLEYYQKFKIRRYGFHGISYKYVLSKYLSFNTSNKSKKIISAHLGSGSSICGSIGLKPIDHSFGFSPNENLIMSTRSGEIDYDAIMYLQSKTKFTNDQITEIINYKSGLLGLTGYTSDMKVILKDIGFNHRAKLALNIYIKSIVKNIFSIISSLNGFDTLIFTGGIGEGSDIVRQKVCKKLSIFGTRIDQEINRNKIDVKDNLLISSKNSCQEIWIIPTDEQRQLMLELTNYEGN